MAVYPWLSCTLDGHVCNKVSVDMHCLSYRLRAHHSMSRLVWQAIE